MAYQSASTSVVYVRKQSRREACNSFLLNNWQHVIFLISVILLIIVVFLLFIAPPSVGARALILKTFAATNPVVGIFAFVNAAVPLGFALVAIGSIYNSLYNYLALLYRNTDFQDDAEVATAWAVSKFLGSLAAKQVSLIASIGVLSVLVTYYLLMLIY